MVTGPQLYEFILQNAEELDGHRLCRVSLIAHLRSLGVPEPGKVREDLVRELTRRGLVKRKHPRSIHLYILTDDQPKPKSAPR